MRYLNPPSPKYVRALRSATRAVLRMAAWNAALVISCFLLIAIAGEAYFRLTKPFIETDIPFRFVDGVGLIREPNAELRYANWHDDLFVISHTNSLGFLDREPVSPERAAAGCHIAVIGDSFVEALEVSIADKFHVRLEEMAARALPRLALNAQAYGLQATGQINQLPLYDQYARRLNPKLVILVFYLNDFLNNAPALYSLRFGVDPDRMPFMSAQRDDRGDMQLRPPDAEYERFLLPTLPSPWHQRAWGRLVGVSYFAAWLNTKNIWSDSRKPSQVAAWANMIAQRPCCARMLDGWRPLSGYRLGLGAPFREERLPPFLEQALDYTEFGIEQFKRRTDRDGANLVILASTVRMGTSGDPQFDRLNAIAEARGIPVISEYDYIARQGYDDALNKSLFRSNFHWTPTGHQWAAEAVLEWLKENQDACE